MPQILVTQTQVFFFFLKRSVIIVYQPSVNDKNKVNYTFISVVAVWAVNVLAWKYSISDFCLQILKSQNAGSKSRFLNKPAAKSLEEITNENLAEANHPYITLT